MQLFSLAQIRQRHIAFAAYLPVGAQGVERDMLSKEFNDHPHGYHKGLTAYRNEGNSSVLVFLLPAALQ